MVPTYWRTRPAPSEPRQALLRRARLSEIVDGRWNRRVTAVVAGAGFGKSALVAEALAANRAEPRGRDAWVGCQVEDAGLDRFFDAIFTAVRDEAPTDRPLTLDDAVDQIAAAVWSQAPTPVTLVIDDVHLLPEGSAGAALLDALVRRLPANAHFLLTARTQPPLTLARLISAGEAAVIDETDLAMTAEELADFAAVRDQPDIDLADTGGWPALAELAVHAGEVRSRDLTDYLTDELLTDLPKSQVEALALLSVVGPLGTDQLVAVLGDRDLDLVALCHLPLVNRTGDLVEAHSLWEVAVASIDPDRMRLAVQATAELLRSSGYLERSFGLALWADDEDLAVEILGDMCREAIHTAAEVDLEGCVAALPPQRRDDPGALLAAAISTTDGGWAASRDRLIAASFALEEAGADDLEIVALTRLGIQGWQASDLSVADHLLPRLERLAGSGVPLAVAVVAIGSAVMGELSGEHETMWSHLDEFEAIEVPEPLRSMGIRYRASLELTHGSPSEAIRLLTPLEALAPSWFRVEVRALLLWAHWMEGDLRGAHHWGDQLRSPAGPTSREGSDIVARSNLALLEAMSPLASGGGGGTSGTGAADGWLLTDVADLLAATAVAREEGLANSVVVLVLAAAARLVADGDEDAARATLIAAFDDPEMVPARILPGVIRGLSLVWLLLPERRETLGVNQLGSGHDATMTAAQTLEYARAAEADSSWHDAALAALTDPGLPTRLHPMWVAELAARYVGPKGDDERKAVARDAVDRLGPAAAPALRRLAARGDSKAVAAGASAILASRTPVSEGRFVLRLLGPMAIERDGVEIDQPDWRRDRVRALFALIARHGTISRQTAAELLWPDLDPEAGANNLRVTLSYLQKVLEPERTRHEVAYHVRGDGASLRFAGRSSWTIDVEEFESLLDAAERDDRRGEPAGALTGYLAAIDWYRGPFLSDVDLGASDEIEMERIRSRHVRALIRAGGLLLAVGRVDEAQKLAVTAQEADPWSTEALLLQAQGYLALGDRAAALRTHERVVALADELGLAPSPDLDRLARAIET